MKKRATKRPANGSDGYPPKRKKRAGVARKPGSLPRDVHEIVEELRDSRAKTIRGKD